MLDRGGLAPGGAPGDLPVPAQAGGSGDPHLSEWAFEVLFRVELAEGRLAKSAILLGAGAGVLRTFDYSRPEALSREFEAAKVSLRAAIGDGAYAAGLARGRAMTLDEAVRFALEGGNEVGSG